MNNKLNNNKIYIYAIYNNTCKTLYIYVHLLVLIFQ